MSRLILIGIVALFALIGVGVTACNGTSVKSGEVGVRVNEIGSNAGVVERELGVGWYWPQWGSYVMRFPTTTRTEVWSDAEGAENQIGPAIQFNNSDGVPTRVAISMQVHMDPTKASVAVQRYRLGFEEMIRGPVQRDLQDAFVQHGLAYTSDHLVRQGASELLASVKATLRERLAAEGIVIDSINMVGSPMLPQSIRDRINDRIEAEQNAATQEQLVQVREAEARQRIATAVGNADAARAAARGRADAMDIEGEALRRNPQVALLRTLERWNGVCPLESRTCVVGAGALVQAQGD